MLTHHTRLQGRDFALCLRMPTCAWLRACHRHVQVTVRALTRRTRLQARGVVLCLRVPTCVWLCAYHRSVKTAARVPFQCTRVQVRGVVSCMRIPTCVWLCACYRFVDSYRCAHVHAHCIVTCMCMPTNACVPLCACEGQSRARLLDVRECRHLAFLMHACAHMRLVACVSVFYLVSSACARARS